MLADSLGNPLSLQQAQSLGAANDFVEGFIACEARVANILQIAETETSAWVQAAVAALHMFAESQDAAANARPYLARAQAALNAASPREQRFVAAVAAWVAGDIKRAINLHEEQAREFPRDLASLKLGQYHLFNAGDSPGMLRLALNGLEDAADVPYMHGMAAFAWEQCHLLPQAETAARQALRLCQREPWAQHALAHVMLTEGRLGEGLEFMESASPGWTGLNSFMLTHNWWHLALFALELEQHERVLDLYDQQVWGVVKAYTQDQIGAVSLLARLELAGLDVGMRWQDVADHLETRLADQVLPFLDLHYLYGLARAGRNSCKLLMRNIEAHAAALATGPHPDQAQVWQTVCVPAGHGLLAHAAGDYVQAAKDLGRALPGMVAIGGSHAQRDLFEQIHLDALIRSGAHAAAQHLLQQRLNASPASLRMRRQGRKVYEALGLGGAVAAAALTPGT